MAPVKKRKKENEDLGGSESQVQLPGTTPQSSLQRLLALDKSHPTLDSQLDEAASILNFPSDWADGTYSSHCADLIPSEFSKPRAEWLLRWALEKLKTQDVKGAQARGNARAWIFLRWLLELIPDPSTMMRAVSFLRIVEQALEERLPTGNAEHADPFQVFESPTPSSVRQETTSRKRKRDTPDDDEHEDLREPEQYFNAVSKVLVILCSRGHGSTSGKAHLRQSDQVKSILRTNSLQAGRLLRLGLHFFHASTFPAGPLGRLDFADVKPFLHIWDLRAVVSTEESNGSAETFSSCCLVPTCKIIQRAHSLPRLPLYSETLRESERLVAKHLFIPARAQFFAALGSASRSKDALDLGRLLAPVAECVQPLFENEPIIWPAVSILESIHHLLDIGIRCSPRRSVRSKLDEAPWNQAMLAALSNAAGIKSDSIPNHNLNFATLQMEDMLNVLTKYSIQPEHEELEQIVLRYSGLAGDDGPVRWSLVAAIINVDATAFVLNPQASAQEGDNIEAKSPGHLILSKLSEHQHLKTIPPMVQSENQVDYPDGRIQQSVILSLIKAYAKVRDLPTFIHHWFSQLKKYRVSGIACPQSTEIVWATEQVVNGLVPFLESSMTKEQIHQLLGQHVSHIHVVAEALQKRRSDSKTLGLDHDMDSAFGASIVMLESITKAINSESTIDLTHEILESLYNTLVGMVERSSMLAQAICSRLYRILGRIWTLLLPLQNESKLRAMGGETTLQSGIFEASSDICHRFSKSLELNDYQKLADGFALLCSLGGNLAVFAEYRDTVLDHVATFLDIGQPPGCDSTTGLMNPLSVYETVQMIDWKLSAAFLDLVSHIALYPSLIRLLSTNQRRNLFTRTVVTSFHETRSQEAESGWNGYTGSRTPKWKTLLVLQNQIFSGRAHEMTSDYLETLLACHKALSSSDEQSTQTASSFFETLYLSLPAQLVSRESRQAILNQTLDSSIKNKSRASEGGASPGSLAVMVQFLQYPTSGARICQDPAALFTLAESCLFSQKTSLVLFEQLSQLSISQALRSQDDDQVAEYLKAMRQKFEPVDGQAQEAVMSPGLLRLMKVLVISLDQVQIPDPSKDLAGLRGFLSDHCNSALDNLRKWASQDQTPGLGTQAGLLDVASILNFAGAFPQSASVSSLLARVFDRGADQQQWEVSTLLCVYQFISRQSSMDMETYARLSRDIITVVKTQGDFADYRSLQESFRQRVSVLEQADLNSFLETLMEQMGDEPNEDTLEMIHVATGQFQRPSSDEEADDEKSRAMHPSTILPALCGFLPRASTPRVFHHLTSSIHMIIRDKPWLVSQHGVDGALATFTLLSTSASPRLNSSSAPAVYGRICSATRDLIMLHRKQLRGRFHLLLPLLQGLLACLFTPESPRSKAAASLPKWLDPSQGLLTSEYAALYSRLLETLCSPSVSSVTSGKHRGKHASESLVDETKVARKYAGQYVQGLIVEFCSRQLSGKMTPDMRGAVLSGIFACIDVVEMDALRAMNASMDQGMRAVWKALYAEWKRSSERR